MATSQPATQTENLRALLNEALRLADALDLPGVAVHLSMACEAMPGRKQAG